MENTNSEELFCWTILHPNKEGASFDFNLYSKDLIPSYIELLGDNCVKYEVRQGLGTPGAPFANFICITNIWIRSRQRFMDSQNDPKMKLMVEKLRAFSDIQTLRQLDQVLS